MTSALWAAMKASERVLPTVSAMQSPAAMAPAALIPNPWLTGRSLVMRMSKPMPGASFSATILVMCATDCTPSRNMFTMPSSLGSTVAWAPLSSLIPMPLDPALMASKEVIGWNTHDTCPGQNAEIIGASHSSPGWRRRPPPSSP